MLSTVIQCYAGSENHFSFYKAVLSNLFDIAGHLVNFPPAGGPQSRGTMASAWSASL